MKNHKRNLKKCFLMKRNKLMILLDIRITRDSELLNFTES